MSRALALAAVLAALGSACAHAPRAERGPVPCSEAWAERGVDGVYDHARDARPTARGNEGYAAFFGALARKACVKRWTVLLHVDGTGRERDALALLAALEAPSVERWRSGASTIEADVIAELVLGEGTRRLHLFRAPRAAAAPARAAELASPIVEARTSTTTDEGRIESFLRWGVSEYPAEDYVVVTWGAGFAPDLRGLDATLGAPGDAGAPVRSSVAELLAHGTATATIARDPSGGAGRARAASLVERVSTTSTTAAPSGP
ncbi:hypothetical protein L6R52_44240, partial [Myxococcota bacterium]|nr:hypothetical protein [Myxococcota bacterium]